MPELPPVFTDPRRMEELVSSIERATAAIERMAQASGRIGDQIEKDIGEVENKVEELFEENRWLRYGKTAAAAMAAPIEAFHLAAEAIDEMRKSWKDFVAEQKKATPQTFKDVGAGIGITGTRGVVGQLKTSWQSIISQLPAGGLIGLAMYGVQRQEGFRATSASIMRTMDTMGLSAIKNAGQVQGEVEKMFHAWGSSGEETRATMEGLSEFNIGEERWGRVTDAAGKAGPAMFKVATALDLVKNLQPGTIGKVLGQAFEATGEAPKELAKQLMSVAGAAEKSKVNFSLLVGAMGQGLSSLRLQRQGVTDLYLAYDKMAAGLERNAGMSRRQAQMAAIRAMPGVTAGISGMSLGMWGVISQRLQSQGIGADKGPFDALMSLRLGETKGAQGNITTLAVTEMQNMLNEQGMGRMEQIRFLETQGFQLEAARAMVDMGKGGASLKDVADAFKDPSKLMLKAMERQTQATNRYDAFMRHIMYDLSKVGLGILTVLVAGFRGTIEILSKDMSDVTGRAQSALRWSSVMDAGFELISQGTQRAAKDISGFGSLFTDITDIMEGRRTKPRIVPGTPLGPSGTPESRRTGKVGEMMKSIGGFETLSPEMRKGVKQTLEEATTVGAPGNLLSSALQSVTGTTQVRLSEEEAAKALEAKYPGMFEMTPYKSGFRSGVTIRVKAELVDESGNVMAKTETKPGEARPGTGG